VKSLPKSKLDDNISMFVVMDLHKNYMQIAVMNEKGKVLENSRIDNNLKQMGKFFDNLNAEDGNSSSIKKTRWQDSQLKIKQIQDLFLQYIRVSLHHVKIQKWHVNIIFVCPESGRQYNGCYQKH
jgi:hypothetical protein